MYIWNNLAAANAQVWLNYSTYDVASISNRGSSCVPFFPLKPPWQPCGRTEVRLRWREALMKGSVCFTGNEAPTSRSLISEFIRPLQISGDKPELLSVKPTFLSRSRAGSPARAFLSEVSHSICFHPKWIWLYLHFSFYKCMDTKTMHNDRVPMFRPNGAGSVLEKRPQPFALFLPPGLHKSNAVISTSRSSSDK